MASVTASAKGLIGHPTFSRSIESHGSAHSADTNYNGWRGETVLPNDDIGTNNSTAHSGKAFLGELRRRREDTILDISLESMKYNGGKRNDRNDDSNIFRQENISLTIRRKFRRKQTKIERARERKIRETYLTNDGI
jgi:hypothetical protein